MRRCIPAPRPRGPAAARASLRGRRNHDHGRPAAPLQGGLLTAASPPSVRSRRSPRSPASAQASRAPSGRCCRMSC